MASEAWAARRFAPAGRSARGSGTVDVKRVVRHILPRLLGQEWCKVDKSRLERASAAEQVNVAPARSSRNRLVARGRHRRRPRFTATKNLTRLGTGRKSPGVAERIPKVQLRLRGQLSRQKTLARPAKIRTGWPRADPINATAATSASSRIRAFGRHRPTAYKWPRPSARLARSVYPSPVPSPKGCTVSCLLRPKRPT